jgi:hypothetical protein
MAARMAEAHRQDHALLPSILQQRVVGEVVGPLVQARPSSRRPGSWSFRFCGQGDEPDQPVQGPYGPEPWPCFFFQSVGLEPALRGRCRGLHSPHLPGS